MAHTDVVHLPADVNRPESFERTAPQKVRLVSGYEVFFSGRFQVGYREQASEARVDIDDSPTPRVYARTLVWDDAGENSAASGARRSEVLRRIVAGMRSPLDSHSAELIE